MELLNEKIEVKQYYLQQLYKWDFKLFLCDILGYADLNNEHIALCDFMIKKSNKSKLVLMPRYSFKSAICTIGYSLWELVKNPNTRILIYSDTAEKAEGFLTDIKNHILGKIVKSKFRSVYGALEVNPKNDKWNLSEIVIKTRTTAMPEPNVDTGGIETSKVAKHYDIIIFDDIVSDLNVTTKEQMDKVEKCYKLALSLLVPGGKIIMLGTRWHFGDLYGRIIAENDKQQIFMLFIRSAEDINGNLLFDNIGPKSLTREFLDFQKVKQGSYIFSCLYQNSPVDDETAIFKAKDFSFHGQIEPTDLYITCTCDPAGRGEDFTAITVVGTDGNMDLHILEIVNEHIQPSEIIDKIINLNYKYKFRMLGIETNFFRGMLEQELRRRVDLERKENERFNLFGTQEFMASSKAGQNKDSRIRALQPFHERGALKFPGEKLELLKGAFSELAFQMLQYPLAPHDDILDSLAYHLPLIRKGGCVKHSEPPRFSPAWLEKQSFEKEIAQNNMLPRRFRKRIEDLSFS